MFNVRSWFMWYSCLQAMDVNKGSLSAAQTHNYQDVPVSVTVQDNMCKHDTTRTMKQKINK